VAGGLGLGGGGARKEGGGHGGKRAIGTVGGGPRTDSKSALTMYSEPISATE
jgi:hypothetical protein